MRQQAKSQTQQEEPILYIVTRDGCPQALVMDGARDTGLLGFDPNAAAVFATDAEAYGAIGRTAAALATRHEFATFAVVPVFFPLGAGVVVTSPAH